MKKLIMGMLMGMFFASVSFASSPNALIKSTPAKDVKILFANMDFPNFTEDSKILSQKDWYTESKDSETTVKKMVQQGWTIQSIFTINAKQYFIVFIK